MHNGIYIHMYKHFLLYEFLYLGQAIEQAGGKELQREVEKLRKEEGNLTTAQGKYSSQLWKDRGDPLQKSLLYVFLFVAAFEVNQYYHKYWLLYHAKYRIYSYLPFNLLAINFCSQHRSVRATTSLPSLSFMWTVPPGRQTTPLRTWTKPSRTAWPWLMRRTLNLWHSLQLAVAGKTSGFDCLTVVHIPWSYVSCFPCRHKRKFGWIISGVSWCVLN